METKSPYISDDKYNLPHEVKEIQNDILSGLNDVARSSGIVSGLSISLKNNNNGFLNYLNHISELCKYISKYFVHHYHDDHAHSYIHSFSEIEENIDYMTPGACRKRFNLIPIIEPQASSHIGLINLLQHEYSTWQDHDNNSLIFGKDFLFHPKDRTTPFQVKQTQLINKKLFLNKRLMIWDEYIQTIHSSFLYHNKSFEKLPKC